MSVTKVREIHTGRSGGDTLQAAGASSKIVRKFRVFTNSATDDAAVVLQSMVNIGVVHPTHGWLAVKDRNAVPDGPGKLAWIATLSYSSERFSSENPLVAMPEVTWNTETSQENAYEDIDGDAVLNSASDYYEDGVPVDAARWILKVKSNVPYVPAWINNYRDAINSDVITVDNFTLAALSAKMSGISIGTWLRLNDIWYRQIEMTIKIKNSWRFSILDQGLRRIVDTGEGDRREKCLNEDGSEATKPVLLDGSGGQLTNPGPTTAVFNEHLIYPELPFSALPLW